MFKRKTSKLRQNKRKRHSRELVLNVRSPRIVFVQILKTIKGMARSVIVFLVVGGLCWFGYNQISNHFSNNEEFAIRNPLVSNFDGEPTVVLAKSRVLEIAGVDLTGTIFSVDLDEAKDLLLARPEIRNVKVQRKLPSTIDIKIQERIPVAWLSCRELGLAGRNPHKGILLDSSGVSFVCEKDFWKVAHSEMGHSSWDIDRVRVENFYTLHVISRDGVVAVCGMHDHDRQLTQLNMARNHALVNDQELEWIDLRPKKNIPAYYKGGASVAPNKYTPKSVEDDGLDPSTRSILNQN